MRTHKKKLFNCSFVRCSADQHQQVACEQKLLKVHKSTDGRAECVIVF